jgi:glycosyltransferase involved in cell wall biosynthesis
MLYTLKALRDEGVENVVVCTEDSCLLPELEQEGFSARLVTSIRKWPVTVTSRPIWTPAGFVETLSIPTAWRSSVRGAQEIIEKEQPNVVHLNMSPLVPVAIAAHRQQIPVVWHIRESLSWRNAPIRAALCRGMIQRYADFVVSINHENLAQLGGVRRSAVINDGVQLDEFHRGFDGREFRRSLACPQETLLVGVLNGVSWIKGTLVFTRAARKALRANRNIMFVNVGEYDWSATTRLQRLKRRVGKALGLRRYVERVLEESEAERMQGSFKLVGALSDVRPALAALDILVFPAMTSHSPLPAIEAAAMAKPVIASDWPAVREIVTHGITGLLFRPGDDRALADAVLALASDPDRRSRMGEAGHELALQRFDQRKNARRLLDVYRETLAAC